jgi:cyclopropane-fatty-acyl-phospholipid synthase
MRRHEVNPFMNPVKTQKPGASAEAVRHHYDVSNEFYRLWLDSTMSYSAAMWEEGDTFEAAQVRKLEFHTKQARASGAKRVLDVGCGWGALLKYLVEMHGVERAVGLTLSKNQAEWIASYNLPQIEVRVESWTDHSPEAPYDAIASMGAFEHFARPNLSEEERVAGYRLFFQRCHQWLKPGGWMSLETVSYENAHSEDLSEFFLTEIYPESDLPTLADIAKATERLFEIVRLRNDREDAANTWRAWLAGLRANRGKAIEIVGEKIVAHYEKYLKLSIIGNHTGTMGQLRMALRRIDKPRR